MQSIRPYVEHGPTGTTFVAPHPAGESRYAFLARTGGCLLTRIIATDGSWAAEIHWPDVLTEQLTFPPAHGTWRRERDHWGPHDPAKDAALLVETVPDPPEVAHRRLEARLAALEAKVK